MKLEQFLQYNNQDVIFVSKLALGIYSKNR
jgi:hypothetical protein